MSDYNTGNPVPSQDPRDLDDNATVFDALLNSQLDYVEDRLEVARKTWHRIEKDAEALVSPNVSALAAIPGSANLGFYFNGPGSYGTYELSEFSRAFAGSDDAAQARSTLEIGAGQSIPALGSLSPVANRLAYFTGSQTADTTPFTAFARSLLDDPDAATARATVGVRNTSTRYIDGLDLTWGANALTVGPGSAYLPGTGALAESSSALTIALAGLTSGTFYHVYLYLSSAGVPTLELSSSAPVSAATGGFAKTGDTSRRYLGSVLANGATSVQRFVHNGLSMHYNAAIAGGSAFELFNGSATTATSVSAAAVVPVTGVSVLASVSNPSTAAGTTLRLSNPDLGTVSNSNHRQFATIQSSWSGEVLLSASLQISYVFDAAPNNPGLMRVHGYTFKR